MTTEGSDAPVAQSAAQPARNTSAGGETPLIPGAGFSVFFLAGTRPSQNAWAGDITSGLHDPFCHPAIFAQQNA